MENDNSQSTNPYPEDTTDYTDPFNEAEVQEREREAAARRAREADANVPLLAEAEDKRRQRELRTFAIQTVVAAGLPIEDADDLTRQAQQLLSWVNSDVETE